MSFKILIFVVILKYNIYDQYFHDQFLIYDINEVSNVYLKLLNLSSI